MGTFDPSINIFSIRNTCIYSSKSSISVALESYNFRFSGRLLSSFLNQQDRRVGLIYHPISRRWLGLSLSKGSSTGVVVDIVRCDPLEPCQQPSR